jgi:transposase InsO family protein
MFGRILSQAGVAPGAISTDHDPLFEFHRWKANMRILEIQEIKTVPHVPLSHPFVERLIGTIRREFLDQVPFWTSTDLERKLKTFSEYYNEARTHRSLDGVTPIQSQSAACRSESDGNSTAALLDQEFAPGRLREEQTGSIDRL